MTTKDILCPHKNICKGTTSPKMYEHVKKISLELGMTQVVEKILKSGKIKFRFEMWTPITFQKEGKQ